MTEYFIFNSYSSLCRKTVKPSFQPPYRGTIGYMRNLAWVHLNAGGWSQTVDFLFVTVEQWLKGSRQFFGIGTASEYVSRSAL